MAIGISYLLSFTRPQPHIAHMPISGIFDEIRLFQRREVVVEKRFLLILEVFLKLFLGPKSFRFLSPPSSWIWRILHFFYPKSQQTLVGRFLDAIWTWKKTFQVDGQNHDCFFSKTQLSLFPHQKTKTIVLTVLNLESIFNFCGNNVVTLLNKPVIFNLWLRYFI